MAYAAHTLIEFGGTAKSVTQNDIWACTLRVIDFNNLTALADPGGYMNLIQANLMTWWTTVAHHTRNDFTLDFLKVNNIGADGKYSNKTTTFRKDYTPTVGSMAPGVPGFLTIAGTWETGNMRGPGHRGRMFLPIGNYPLVAGSSSEIAGTDRDAIRNIYSDLFGVLCTHFDTGANKAVGVVASKVNATNTIITGVSVDSVWDVQRRRKNKIKGTRSAALAVAAS